MFDISHGFIFVIGSMTLIISILVIVLLLVNNKKGEEEPNEVQKSIQKIKDLKGL